VAVVAGDQLFIVDTGTDGARNLGRMGYPASQVAAVFLTHFHSDHIDGLGELATARWATSDHTLPLPVYGPEGVARVVDGFNAAYAQDFTYRHDHHGDQVAPLSAAGITAMPFKAPPEGVITTVFDEAGLVVQALRVDHAPVSPAVGYLFRYGQRTALITGDTAQSDNVKRFAQGVDLLVHEALAPEPHDYDARYGRTASAIRFSLRSFSMCWIITQARPRRRQPRAMQALDTYCITTWYRPSFYPDKKHYGSTERRISFLTTP
jgi:ribonuclease Z